MSVSQVRELRKAGKLNEAYVMASREYDHHPYNIYNKRALAWVHYAFCKKAADKGDIGDFIINIKAIRALEMYKEVVFTDALLWCYTKLFHVLSKDVIIRYKEAYLVFHSLKSFYFTIPSEGFSAFLEQLHKVFKTTPVYLYIFEECLHLLSPQDFLPKTLGEKQIMPLAEQIYTAYAKHILMGVPSHNDKWNCIEYTPYEEMITEFLPTLNQWIASYPSYSFLPYFKAKMELFIGDENALNNFLPFAKKQTDKVWVWQLLSQMVTDDELAFSCLCKALSLSENRRFSEKTRIKFCKMLLKRKLYNEARTEVDIIVEAKKMYIIPPLIAQWQEEWWYTRAVPLADNSQLYNSFKTQAENFLI